VPAVNATAARLLVAIAFSSASTAGNSGGAGARRGLVALGEDWRWGDQRSGAHGSASGDVRCCRLSTSPVLPPPGGQPTADQGAAMTPERLGRHLNAVLSGQPGCSFGGGAGAQGLGKGGVALQQLLELMQRCS